MKMVRTSAVNWLVEYRNIQIGMRNDDSATFNVRDTRLI
jgi:hypothetical protein